ncbi:unnamed protein product [Linum tenue]|uniref:Uncharacterized protein n=1 Tax=Linum tenue TaxID=586396 RepID=A0AAV0LFT8_9ROSI|nr:unnamed protein product [Linum tenue]
MGDVWKLLRVIWGNAQSRE